jgi:ferritin-like metal-binding protein YciE
MKHLLQTGVILLFAQLFQQPCFAEETTASGETLSAHFEMLNALTKSELRLENQRLKASIEKQLAEIDKQNEGIRIRLTQRDNDIGNYIDAISWVTGIVIGFVGILFGMGAFILYRENQEVSFRMNQQLEAWNEQTENLQATFDKWFNDAKIEHTREIDSMGRIMRLRILLDQEKPNAREIYPDLSPLFSNPQLEYLPIFRRVMTLNIDKDIKRHTQAAIDQIKKRAPVLSAAKDLAPG